MADNPRKKPGENPALFQTTKVPILKRQGLTGEPSIQGKI